MAVLERLRTHLAAIDATRLRLILLVQTSKRLTPCSFALGNKTAQDQITLCCFLLPYQARLMAEMILHVLERGGTAGALSQPGACRRRGQHRRASPPCGPTRTGDWHLSAQEARSARSLAVRPFWHTSALRFCRQVHQSSQHSSSPQLQVSPVRASCKASRPSCTRK
jgi:hypothetical protein